MASERPTAAEELRRHRQHCPDCATARHHRHGYGCDRGQELEAELERQAAELEPDPRQAALF